MRSQSGSFTIEVFHCYRIAGRRPIVVMMLEKRANEPDYIYLTGYTPKRFKEYEKFWRFVDVGSGDFRIVAEVEGTVAPKVTRFRFRPSAKIEEVEL